MNTRPRLLQICAVDFTVYHFLLPLARRLRDLFDVHFVSADGPYVNRVREEGFRYHCVPIRRSYDVVAHTGALVQLRGLMSSERFAVVHAHTPIAGLIGRVAAALAGVPVRLYTAHGFYFHERMSPAKHRFFVTLEKIGARLTDFTFTQSAEDRDAAVRLGIAPESRVACIGNGVDLQRFDPDRLAPERSRVREELGYSDGDRVVCIVGRLVREKGYVELVEAFAGVVEDVPEARLVAVGGALESDRDGAAEEIRAVVKRVGLGDRVRFLEFRSDVERVLCAADLFVLPSHREGMPRSVIEAMAMRLPVVATNIRGSREVVADGETGILVEVGDRNALRTAIVRLIRDGEASAQFGGQARRRAVERFDEAVVIARQIEAIRRVCTEKGIATG